MKGKLGVSTGYQDLWYDTPLYNRRIMNKIISTQSFEESEKAQFRLKVIEFHGKYGIGATKDAFTVSKATIYRWRKKLNDSGGRLASLVPKPTTPQRKRQMMIHTHIIRFIKQTREDHPRLGKEKIKPLLNEYCLAEKLQAISVSTIGKIITRYGLLSPHPIRRYYHNPNDKRNRVKRQYKTRIKHSPKVGEFGYIEIDTIVKFLDGMKLYVFNAIDIKLKFQFSYAYARLNSQNAREFFNKLEAVYPIRDGIKIVQTDNGLEFQGAFSDYLKQKQINHLFIYPRCPKINAYVERANRTLQEEFVNNSLEYVTENLTDFNARLMDYLVWYNTRRVHNSLNNISPIDYLLHVAPESQKWVTYT